MFGGLFKKKDNKMILGAPVKGKAVPLSEVNDPTFAEEMLGKGMAVIPAEGKIYAPADGEIGMVFDTLHAVSLVSEARQAHGHGRGKNERHDARPHAGEKGLNAAVFHEVPQHGGDEQQEQKRRQHDAERRDQRAPEAPLRRTDECGHIHGQRAGRRLRDGDKAQKLRFRQPAVGQNGLPHKGDHAVAAAEGQRADH